MCLKQNMNSRVKNATSENNSPPTYDMQEVEIWTNDTLSTRLRQKIRSLQVRNSRLLARNVALRDQRTITCDENLRNESDLLRNQNASLRHENIGIRARNEKLLSDNVALYDRNNELCRQNGLLHQLIRILRNKNLGLIENKNLIGENSTLRRELAILKNENIGLEEKVVNCEGVIDVYFEFVKNVLEQRNVQDLFE